MAKDLTKVSVTLVTSGAFQHAACHSVEAVSAVSRIRAHSDMYEMDLLLDINSDLYPVDVSKARDLHLDCTVWPSSNSAPLTATIL